jgi:acyl-CoA-binding protein
MSDLDAAFTQASEAVTSLANDPGNEAKLSLYALYKQATSGDVGGKKPSRFDMVGRAKYEAWEKLAGTSSDDAKQRYVDLVRSLGG